MAEFRESMEQHSLAWARARGDLPSPKPGRKQRWKASRCWKRSPSIPWQAVSPTPPSCGLLQRREVELGLGDGRTVENRSALEGTELVILRGNGVMRASAHIIAIPER